MSSAEDKKAKAEARKAKLLSKGGDRLAKITGQGRPGEDFDAPIKPPTPTPPSELTNTSTRVPTFSSSTSAADPEDIDLSSLGPNSARAFGDSLTGAIAPDPFSFLQGGGGGIPDFLKKKGMTSEPPIINQLPRTRSLIQVCYTILHFISISALAIYAVVVLEPLSLLVEDVEDVSLGSTLGRWGKLRWQESEIANGGIGVVPLFTTFVTMEIVLQTIHAMFVPARPSAPSMLSTVESWLPPNIKFYLNTGKRYWAIVNNLLDDLSILIFVVGFCIMVGSWDREHQPLKMA